MKNGIPGIDVKTPIQNPTVDSEYSFYELPYFKTDDYFFDVENEVKFIESIERSVRKSKYYKRYISHLKTDFGLNFCQVKGNIQENEDDKHELIEMHHGPVLTLFDCVAIVLEYSLVHKLNVSTFDIANIIIKEHFDHHIQTVMLCETVHQEVHDGKIFLNLNQGFGDLNAFLTKYKDGLLPEQILKINKYIELSKENDSYDNNVMKLNESVTKWSKDLCIDDWFE